MIFHKSWLRWGLVAICLFILVACGSRRAAQPVSETATDARDAFGMTWPALAPVSLAAGEKLRVLATTSLIADVVAQVGGQNIQLHSLIPLGADPHAFEPTPQDLRAVADAHIIFINGLGLEEFLAEMLKNAGSDAPVVPVSYGITPRTLTTPEEEGHQEYDPHVWFDPTNVIIWTQNIEQALSTLDPSHAEEYQARAQAYIEQLRALDAWIQEQVAQIPESNRKLVADHDVLGYFAERYGFEWVGAVLPTFSSAAEPSAQELARLEDAIRTLGVPAIFVGKTVNPKLASQIAQDTGVQLVHIYTGSLGPPGSGAETYLDYMRYNVRAIVAALAATNE